MKAHMSWISHVRSWFRSPYGLLGAFLALTLGPALGLVWFGWRMLDQDRALETQRITERREHAADQLVAALERALKASEADLTGLLHSPLPGEDALTAEIGPSGIRAYPEDSLVFYPEKPALTGILSDRYREAETYEFQDKNYAKAIAELKPLTTSPDPSTRAGAWLRIARNQRKAGRFDKALKSYDELAGYSETVVAGLPAELVARRSRCALLDELNRKGDLLKEAADLYSMLRNGHWHLSRSAYDVFADEAAAWAGADRNLEIGAIALAEAVEWAAANNGEQISDKSGRVGIVRQGRLVSVLWSRQEDGVRILAAGPAYLKSKWLDSVTPLADKLGVLIYVKELNPDAEAPTIRVPSAGGLPWTVLVASKNLQALMNAFAGRRNLLLGIFALLAVVIGAGTYMVARAIAREFAAMRLQSEFVSAVSHEFRTPLTSLRQLSEALNEGRPLGEKRLRNYYQVLDRATRRLHKLVEGLLDFGRMEARSMVYRKCDLAAGDFLMSVVNEFQSEAADNGYHIETHIAQDLPGIHADPEALGNAVWNLLDNAVKYSPEYKTIRVEVERQGAQVAIRIKDQGLGISADERDRILRKFVRGAAAETMGIKGTGVGLAMVKHIVDAHGGALRIESAPGKGSTFSIVLPAGR